MHHISKYGRHSKKSNNNKSPIEKEKRIALTLRGMLIRIKQKKKTKKEVLETDGNGKEQTGARA